jgi:serine protease Do
MSELLKDKKALTALGAGAAVCIVLFLVFSAAPAHANFFDDLWKNITTPFLSTNTGGTLNTTAAQSNQPLYKPALDYERAVIDAVKKASPAVVSVTISKYVPILEQCQNDPFGDLPPEFQQFFDQGGQTLMPCNTGKTQLQEVGGGSGFIISSDGLILTNKHVVSDANASYTVLTNDGKKYDAKVLARDPVQDLAVIKISASGLPTVDLGDSDTVELGQTAIAIGNALGEFRNTVSTGVVSGLARTVTASGGGATETIQGVIQTDAAINPGNSGGPLLNLRGEVIGINTAIATNAQGIGFAIPINRAKRDIDSVKTTGSITVPYLGVRYTMTDSGAEVSGTNGGPAVAPGSPAQKAGIVSGDVITAVDGKKVDADHPLTDIISGMNVGQTVALTVNRAGKTITINVTLEKRPENL